MSQKKMQRQDAEQNILTTSRRPLAGTPDPKSDDKTVKDPSTATTETIQADRPLETLPPPKNDDGTRAMRIAPEPRAEDGDASWLHGLLALIAAALRLLRRRAGSR